MRIIYFIKILIQQNCSWARHDVCTHSQRIKILVDEVVDDLRQVVLEHGVALGLQGLGAHHGAHGVADLLEELHDLVLGGGVGDEVVDVGDHVDADGAGELVLGLGGGEGAGDEGGDEEGELHPEFLGGLFVGLLWLLWVLEE